MTRVPVYEIGLVPQMTREQMVELLAGLMRG
jgi:hypothetical protein